MACGWIHGVLLLLNWNRCLTSEKPVYGSSKLGCNSSSLQSGCNAMILLIAEKMQQEWG